MKADLGKLVRIRDLRSVWPHEASDFTPWLAQPENLEQLSSELNLDLELVGTEVPVGPYSADILATDAFNDHKVVIENQLEKTNHDHLGKALTYGAILGASVIIWITKEFSDEHRKTLDWLNDHTDENLSFYGICIELWKVGDSPPAPRFNVVSRPASLIKQARAESKTRGELTETRKLQLEFWTAVRDSLQETNSIPSVQSPRPQYWYNIALGRSNIHLSAFAGIATNRMGVRVYFRNKDNTADIAIEQLLEDREAIEKEIGGKLSWNPNPEKTDKIIVLDREADFSQRQNWDEYITWITETVLAFRSAFRERVRNLDLTLVEDDEEDL